MFQPIIIIDTREQTPLQFPADAVTKVATLHVGDYSLEGMEDRIVIERKSLPDLLGCIGRERDRFEKELRQLRSFQYAALLVESTWGHITSGNYGCPSQVAPSAVVGSICAWAWKYRVHAIMAQDHRHAGEIAYRILTTYARQIEKDFKAISNAALAPMSSSTAPVINPDLDAVYAESGRHSARPKKRNK